MQVRPLGQEDPLEKEMETHSSILCLGNPMDRGAWWVIVHGVTNMLDRAEWLNNKQQLLLGKIEGRRRRG